ncbi:hypothetical protein An01g05910 [Aspergillus niger]|uniref:Uncharacterized protein n=2 Tax=Aspergillus niger TaxID=5061 RepID=A2Q8X6_ASPNC|nr:hypothetical protein An01g05910 [Aspergillus niger]CAK37066.1 hypothetical protein An01g05910 [Aspergillus niger]
MNEQTPQGGLAWMGMGEQSASAIDFSVAGPSILTRLGIPSGARNGLTPAQHTFSIHEVGTTGHTSSSGCLLQCSQQKAMDPVVWSEFPAAGLQNVPEKRVILGSWRGIDILQTCHGLSNPKRRTRPVRVVQVAGPDPRRAMTMTPETRGRKDENEVPNRRAMTGQWVLFPEKRALVDGMHEATSQADCGRNKEGHLTKTALLGEIISSSSDDG